jgi:hypothetical protein
MSIAKVLQMTPDMKFLDDRGSATHQYNYGLMIHHGGGIPMDKSVAAH